MLWMLLVVAVGQCAARDLIQTLVHDQKESTLVQLVTKAGLGPALSSGDFTIFAPTDAAFAKLPQATLDALNADNAALQQVLKYHVVPGTVLSADLRNEETVTTLSGQKLRVNIYSHNNVVTVEGANVSETDRRADNGVIHIVDDVLLAPTGDIVDIVAGDPRFSTLLTAVQTVPGLADALKASPMTLFAPTNDAFKTMQGNHLQLLLDNPDRLKEVLTYHVIDHTLYSAGLYDREVPHSADTRHDRLVVRVRSSGVSINEYAHVTQADISATNGVIHVLDHVLVPAREYLWLSTGGLIG